MAGTHTRPSQPSMDSNTTQPKRTKKSFKKEDIERRNTGKDNPVAYVLTDKIYGEFEVMNSANAWWLDRIKVMKLFDAYKFDCTDLEAMAYAGISRMQFQYFKQLHPDFYEKKDMCMQNLGLLARQKLGAAIERGEGGAILAYLRKKHKAEWGSGNQLPPGAQGGMPELPGGDVPTDVDQRNMIVFVDFSQGSTDELLGAGEAIPTPAVDVTDTGHDESQ